VPSKITLVRRVNENAFVSETQTRPCPPLADRFISGFPIDYGVSIAGWNAKGLRRSTGPLPSEVPLAVASGRSWLYPAFAFVPV